MSDLNVNRRHWDALADVHAQGTTAIYDAAALVSGRRQLGDAEAAAVRAAVGDAAGRDVLHVQCHLAYDGIVLARRGARVTGVDFSPRALAGARKLAERAGVALETVQAEATALPASLHGRFDLAYATIGVLSWIADVDAWMRSVAATLRPGGALALVEIHPIYEMLESVAPLRLDFPYAFDGPRRFDEDGSYADQDASIGATEQIAYAHALGETVTAAIRAGLAIELLQEHLDCDHDPRGDLLPADDDGRHRLRIDGEVLPVLFTLVARRPG
ncbi:MAG TPA: class I SAM-dependent methyltransferase [Solirubrobacteraceae bacterium]|nr:class I SAM-dependent methyltransferase [Solirubrobacteraceae bacterium]